MLDSFTWKHEERSFSLCFQFLYEADLLLAVASRLLYAQRLLSLFSPREQIFVFPKMFNYSLELKYPTMCWLQILKCEDYFGLLMSVLCDQ